jgi:signal transduction histidine kinase
MDRMKDEFVSVVSHELRTPLTSNPGSLGLIAGGVMGVLPDKAQHMADIAVSNADRLIRLINDILDIERVESGGVTMAKTACYW